MSADGLDPSILAPAFLAGLLVLATHVPLGREVLARGIIFVDLAVAQIAGLGVIGASAMGWETRGWATQIAAVGAALAGALLLRWIERRWSDAQEALIGTLFVLAATGGILLLSHDPHGGEHLKDLLVGQILWVSYRQLIPVTLLYAIVLACWFLLPGIRRGAGFYLLFALTITASVQLVGVYLVFASLIIPALSVFSRHGSPRLRPAYTVGAVGYGLGLGASGLFDLPAGATVVWALAGLALVTKIFLTARAPTNPA
jgi:zinc/manganese transport system permease protein